MASSPDSLIFIPDISGFTSFVKETDISHSRHIVAELLEGLIDADELGLTAAELEGDAVFFYKQPSELQLPDLLAQAERMFLRFHGHLAQYESYRICNCGACSTANRLTLKIVAHQGRFGIIRVKQFQKPYGADVVLAHRLLKNEVPIDEYLLVSQALLKDQDLEVLQAQFPWAEFIPSSSEYDSFGEVDYVYIPLHPLYERVEALPPPPKFAKTQHPLQWDIKIDRTVDDVYYLLYNLNLRESWQKGTQGIIYNENRLNRIGTQHTCLVPGGKLHFETVQLDTPAYRRSYSERIKGVPFVKAFVIHFELEAHQDHTHLHLEVHPYPRPLFGRLLTPLFRRFTRRSIPGLLADLKAVAESFKIPGDSVVFVGPEDFEVDR